MAVDVNMRRSRSTSNQAHIAGLNRLRARANNNNGAKRGSCFTLDEFARKIIQGMKDRQMVVEQGLSDIEVSKIEAKYSFTFPPDLRSILQQGLPATNGFPNWRSLLAPTTTECERQITTMLKVPVDTVCSEVSKGKLWCKSWGTRPCKQELAVNLAKQALKKVPMLIPLFGHFYMPSSPHLSGNPVFSVSNNEFQCCGNDLVHFFMREGFSLVDGGSKNGYVMGEEGDKSTVSAIDDVLKSSLWRKSMERLSLEESNKNAVKIRWIDFWTDLVQNKCFSDPFYEIDSESLSSSGCSEFSETPKWLVSYMDDLSAMLKSGGWKDDDIKDMVVHEKESDGDDFKILIRDGQAFLEGMLLKVDSISKSLTKAGWSSQDLSDVFFFDINLCSKEKVRKTTEKQNATVVERFGKLLSN